MLYVKGDRMNKITEVDYVASIVATYSTAQKYNVSWQSLETRYSILDIFELRVETVNELVTWLISREINCTNAPQTKYVYMQSTSLASNHSAHFGIQKQIIAKLHATDSIANTNKGTRVFSCDRLC